MRKIRAQYIFDGYKLRKDATVVVNNNEIVEVYENESSSEEAGVEFYNGIVCPGFVNAHCHLELSHFHNKIEQHTGLSEFVSQISKIRKQIDFSLEACQKADALMKKNGIVAVGDISNCEDSFPIKEQSKITYQTFIEIFDLHLDNSPAFDAAKAIFKKNRKKLKLSLSPHAPYSCSKKMVVKIAAHAKEYEYPISIHNQEQESENEMFMSKSGELYESLSSRNDFSNFKATNKTSLQTMAPLFSEKNHVLFVHNVHTLQEDLDFIKSIRTSDSYTFVLCPQSNLFISNELPPIDLFVKNNIPFAFGTDSLASNTTLSILDEIKSVQKNYTFLPLEKLLFAATNQGARALKINSKIGSFKKGKTPGINLIENLDLHNLKITEETTVRVLV